MKPLLLLSLILLSACDRQIPFDEQGNNNSYLSCSNISDGNVATRWRNVILDKTNLSVRSQKYFIYDSSVEQWGAIFDLRDNYDDYQIYAKWEKSILESLEIEAIRQKAQSERTEENKQI